MKKYGIDFTGKGFADFTVEEINHIYEETTKIINDDTIGGLEKTIAYYMRGVIYSNKNYPGKAISDYTLAIEYNAKLACIYNNRGCHYMDFGKDDEALQDFNIALELDENYSECYFNRAILYWSKNDYDLALNDLNKYLQFNPNDKEVQQFKMDVLNKKDLSIF